MYKRSTCFLVAFLSFFFFNICYATVPSAEELLDILDDLTVASDCNGPKYERKNWRH